MQGIYVCWGSGIEFRMFRTQVEVQQLINDENELGWMKVLKCPAEDDDPIPGIHYELLQDTSWRPTPVVIT